MSNGTKGCREKEGGKRKEEEREKDGARARDLERQKAGQGTGQRDWGWGGRTRCTLRQRNGEGNKKR